MQKKVKRKPGNRVPSTKSDTCFQENVDGWIKDINIRFAHVNVLSTVVKENTSNIQHNYELIQQVLDEVQQLRQDIETLKLVQLVALNQQRTIKN